MENCSLLCKANMTDSFIFIVKKLKISEALYSASGCQRTINVQETVFQEEGLTMENTNLPQGE